VADGPYLIIGASGMLGRAVSEALRHRGDVYRAATKAEVNLARDESVHAALAEVKPRFVINCAAWTDVDGAEANEDAATELNGHAVGRLAKACREANATLVHYSTDYVFDGQGTSPYPVDAPIRPLNAYGRSKAAGERLIAEETGRGLSSLVLRTSWLYAPWGKNFVRTIANAARQRPTLRVVNDQRGRPTSAEHLAAVTLSLLDAGATGVLHATDGGEATWYDFAARIAAFANPACVVEPCTSAEFPRPAKRPAYSVLDLTETVSIIGPMPDWKSNLDSVLARLEP
jgi:dTDP-4-dehydrorhamnose reductase